MNVRVLADGREYEVEIEDLRARPIVAIVEGERFEVWPEGRPATTGLPARRTPRARGDLAIRAPIPGVIVTVSVKPGDTVSAGQEICVLEAMKMRNPIHATRAGTVAAVPIAPGQPVKHRDVLIELAG
jgi:biotin carboxyl carrier protein